MVWGADMHWLLKHWYNLSFCDRFAYLTPMFTCSPSKNSAMLFPNCYSNVETSLWWLPTCVYIGLRWAVDLPGCLSLQCGQYGQFCWRVWLHHYVMACLKRLVHAPTTAKGVWGPWKSRSYLVWPHWQHVTRSDYAVKCLLWLLDLPYKIGLIVPPSINRKSFLLSSIVIGYEK